MMSRVSRYVRGWHAIARRTRISSERSMSGGGLAPSTEMPCPVFKIGFWNDLRSYDLGTTPAFFLSMGKRELLSLGRGEASMVYSNARTVLYDSHVLHSHCTST